MMATVLGIWKDLTRVEDAVWVEGHLKPLHQPNLITRQLQPEIRCLGDADPMFAADRTFERNHTLEQAANRSLTAHGTLGRSPVRNHDVHVNVSVAGVAETRNSEAAFLSDLIDEREQLRYTAA